MRSNPGALLSSLVNALGKSHAYALIGSSQGACAVFNAVLDYPSLTRFIAVCDPVGHSPHRYSQIRQPTLLISDVDDSGHPVHVVRQMRDFLQQPFYFEHSSKAEPCYHEERMAEDLLHMFASYPNVNLGVGGQMIGESIGGWKAWNTAHGREYKSSQDFDPEEMKSLTAKNQSTSCSLSIADCEGSTMKLQSRSSPEGVSVT